MRVRYTAVLIYAFLIIATVQFLYPLVSKIEVAFQNGLRLTVDFFRESWPTVDSRGFKKRIATVANRQSIFRGFCCGFFIGFQWENGRIRTKWPQNLQKFPSKSTVDYVADPRSCNSLLFSRKLTSKVDFNVWELMYCDFVSSTSKLYIYPARTAGRCSRQNVRYM